ncbi:UNKNOWN [Stylonychia lemnae]|uniref:Transmembrane protein n=1 Tax=Stylonychia lemnae TaxID=5949 RepID=A0A078A5Z6_STYLE|nr:UNKNOWN [Stylonychia lemnae]|eukprot:CDW77321.1 UNKNOWN [Stylonychia lemnae]
MHQLQSILRVKLSLILLICLQQVYSQDKSSNQQSFNQISKQRFHQNVIDQLKEFQITGSQISAKIGFNGGLAQQEKKSNQITLVSAKIWKDYIEMGMGAAIGLTVDLGSRTEDKCVAGFSSLGKNIYLLYLNAMEYYKNQTNIEQSYYALFYLVNVIKAWNDIECQNFEGISQKSTKLLFHKHQDLKNFFKKKTSIVKQQGNNSSSNSTITAEQVFKYINSLLTEYPALDAAAIYTDLQTFRSKYYSSQDFEAGFVFGKGVINAFSVLIALVLKFMEK